MPLTADQATSLLIKAKKQKPDLTPVEAKAILAEGNKRIDAQTSDTRDPLQKVADFMGLGNTVKTLKIGLQTPVASAGISNQDEKSKDLFKQSQSLIKLAMQEKDPIKKQALLDQSRQLDQSINQTGERANRLADIVQQGGQITPSEMNMTNGEFALRRGGATALEVGSYLVPGAGEAGTIGGRLINAGVRGVESGALQAAAGASKESTNPLDALLRIGSGGVVGGITGSLVQGVLETPQIAKEFWSSMGKKLTPKAKNLYASTLKENIADQKFIKQYGGLDNVISDAQKYEAANTKNGVTKQLEEYGPKYNDMINAETDRLQSLGKRINLARAFKNAQATVEREFGHDATLLSQAKNWFKANGAKYKNSTNALPKTANELRKSFDKKVGDVLTADAAPADAARKAFATELRKEFKSQVSQQTKDAIQKYQLLSGLSKAMRKEPIAGLAEGTTAAAGAAAGSLLGGPMALLSALGGYGASVAARSPGLKRGISQGIIRAGQAEVPKIVRSAINSSPVVNPAVAALQRVIDKQNKYKTNTSKLP